MIRSAVFVFLLASCAPDVASQEKTVTSTEQSIVTEISAADVPTIYDVVVVNSYPHDTDAFTQGLFFAEGTLYESTGQLGESQIRRLSLDTNEAIASVALPDNIFGEGSTFVGNRIISLSWRAGKGFVHDLDTLERRMTFPVAGEGWGLTYDGSRLILSDGTNRLRFLDSDTFVETGAITVTLNGQSVNKINELEWIKGEVWANIWQEDVIVRINPVTGKITGLIDVSPLFPQVKRREPFNDVPNGIAWDPNTNRLFLTGKRWPQIFEVELKSRGQNN